MKHGYTVVTLDDGLEPNDFWDTIHLAPGGGNKLAQRVRVEVQALAATTFGRVEP